MHNCQDVSWFNVFKAERVVSGGREVGRLAERIKHIVTYRHLERPYRKMRK